MRRRSYGSRRLVRRAVGGPIFAAASDEQTRAEAVECGAGTAEGSRAGAILERLGNVDARRSWTGVDGDRHRPHGVVHADARHRPVRLPSALLLLADGHLPIPPLLRVRDGHHLLVPQAARAQVVQEPKVARVLGVDVRHDGVPGLAV